MTRGPLSTAPKSPIVLLRLRDEVVFRFFEVHLFMFILTSHFSL